ncbi:MAG: hypothetical protein ORO03_11145, partial [Alphaproteobacteria bacterium]|nr:hypothetical protein [Alphaproteobacteria bacterium]
LPLSLEGVGEVRVSGGRMRIDLGTGGMKSTPGNVNGQPGSLKLNATGMDVFFTSGLTLLNGTGSARDNDGTIKLGSGKFTFVNDKRSVTSAKTLNNGSTSSDWGTGIGSFWSSTVSLIGIADGITLEMTATTETAIKAQCDNQGVVYGGAVTIDGVASNSSPARNLTYIEGNGLTVSGSASGFTGSLYLVSRGTAAVTLSTNLNSSGELWIRGSTLSLTKDVTLAGGNLVLWLGNSGLYDNGTGAGFTLTATNLNLALTAGSIRNPAATQAIFDLGTGTLTTTGPVTVADSVTNSDPIFNSDYIHNSTEETWRTNVSVPYYFTSNGGSKKANSVNGLWFDAAAMTAANLGSKTSGSNNIHYNTDGLSKSTGQIFWRTAGSGDSLGTSTTSTLVLQDGHPVYFVDLTNPSMPSTMPSWLSTSSSIRFEGANSFNTDLILQSTGDISQSTDSSLTITKTVVGMVTTDHELRVTGSSFVTLGSAKNRISSLGVISSTGSILITNGSNLSLNGDLQAGATANAGNRVDIILTNRAGLTLKRSITSYGAVKLALDKGVYTAAGFFWDTNGRSLILEAGSISGSGKVFAVSANGRFNTNINFGAGFVKPNLYFTNDSESDRQAILAFDPDAEIHTNLRELNDGIDKGSFT